MNPSFGAACPPCRLRLIAAAARAWAAFVASAAGPGRGPSREYLRRKARDAMRFSATATRSVPASSTGPADGTRSPFGLFAVPSKLVGVRAAQAALVALRTALASGDLRFGARLDLRVTRHGNGQGKGNAPTVTVLHGGVPLGRVQDRHARWLAPLIDCGLTVHVLQVTGDEERGLTLGLNVAFGHVAEALAAFHGNGGPHDDRPGPDVDEQTSDDPIQDGSTSDGPGPEYTAPDGYAPDPAWEAVGTSD